MAVIIGAGSNVTSTQFSNNGIVSVQFGFNPQVQRLWELGSFSPYDSFVTKTKTLTINVYGSKPDGTGGSSQLSVTPSTTCTDAGTVTIGVQPASCTSSIADFSDDFFITGYSYQKENLGYGQETWTFTSKPIIDNYTGTIVMLRGIAEGQVATGDGIMTSTQMGVVVDETASNDSLGAAIEGESGSVQAGTPGIGEYNVQRYVIVTAVGGSVGKHSSVDGYSGQANIQIPMTPVYI
jgi:hypothetical protein